MSKITVNEFEKLVLEKNTGLIVGNGFSMNFDSSFGNIYDALKEGTFTLIKNGNFIISPAAKPHTKELIKLNYSSVLKYVRTLTQKQLEEIFIDAIDFARFIITNKLICDFIKQSKHLHSFKVGPDMLEITKNIYQIGSSKGFQYVNIENWPILIWLFHLIEYQDEFIYYKKLQNRFITLLTIGGQKRVAPPNSPGDVMANTRFNGFSIYYRLLMITIIFGKGKAVDLQNLQYIANINQESLMNWLQDFKELFSLNYDLILEQVGKKTVTYLHGNFQDRKQAFTLFQSYSIKYGNKEFFTNDIILGDYNTTKVLDAPIHTLVLKNHAFTQPRVEPLTELKNKMDISKLNHIVFFGMHPENDYHILSGIYYNFLDSRIDSPSLTFCYFNEEEIKFFTDTFYNVINSIYKNKELLKSIELNFVDSKEIINKYF